MEQSNHHAAILWDMDGVLVDTWELHAQTWVQAFEEFNIPLDASQIKTTFGMNSMSSLQLLLGEQYQQDFLLEVNQHRISLLVVYYSIP